MRRSNPIQRAIQVVIASPERGREVMGILYANDFGDGATRHSVEGYLTGPQGVQWKASGHLSGIQFEPMPSKGAPKKIGRNVALFLAYQWFFFPAVLLGETRMPAVVLRWVMDLWQNRGFKGVTEETHVRKLVKAGAECMSGYRLLRQETTIDGKPSGVVFAVPQGTFSVLPDGQIGLHGPGWMWRYGEEEAVYGRLSGGTSGD